MGLLRWLLWPLRSDKRAEDDEPRRRPRKGKSTRSARSTHHPGVYRIEVDSEASRFHGDGPPFSFWSSSRIILILSFLLWWIQPAGPMIAGYVGGRRAGSPMKSVTAALLPVATIYIANAAYAHNLATHQIDFVASLPTMISDGASSILPFLGPYKEFMISYMQGFVQALTTTFGMGTNGYLMVVIFAYIGGLIAEQTRRELTYRSGSGASLGVNLVQPLLGARPYVDEEEEAYEDDEEISPRHRPVRTYARRRHAAPIVVAPTRKRHRRGLVDSFDEYRRVPAEVDDVDGGRRATRSHRREADEEDDDDEGEVVEVRPRRMTHDRGGERTEHHRSRSRADDEETEDAGRDRAPTKESRPMRIRTQAEERAIQRFVERALRNYDHSKI